LKLSGAKKLDHLWSFLVPHQTMKAIFHNSDLSELRLNKQRLRKIFSPQWILSVISFLPPNEKNFSIFKPKQHPPFHLPITQDELISKLRYASHVLHFCKRHHPGAVAKTGGGLTGMQRRLGDHCYLAQEIQESRPLRIRAQRCLAHWTWQPFFPPSRSEGGDRVD
jgi:hypothetical protein